MSDTNPYGLPADIEDSEEDVLPSGTNYAALPTGLYPCKIKHAYKMESRNGADGVVLVMQCLQTNSEIKETIYMSSGKQKGQRYYYIRDGKKYRMPGLVQMDQLHKIITGRSIDTQNLENKVVKIYNYDTQTEVNTEVPTFVEFLGQEILVGLFKVRKNRLLPDGQGGFEETSEEVFRNEINKFFDPQGHTATEKLEGAPAEYVKKWKERFDEDYVKDEYNEVASPVANPNADTSDIDDLF